MPAPTRVAPHLDRQSRSYWEGRSLQQGGRRRISIFARNAYRHGVLGRFIGFSHAAARLYGVDLRRLLSARSIEEQRQFFETMLAPLFDKPAVRWVTANRLSLYGLGIPPAQYEALAGDSDMRHVLRARIERLACGFSLDDNYFAWQAFGRPYAGEARGPNLLFTPSQVIRDRWESSTDPLFSVITADGASSSSFWWRLWIEHSRSPRCTMLPLASAMIWISTWRGASTYFSL